MKRQGKTEVNWAERHATWIQRWAQRRYLRPLHEPIRPDRTIGNGYIQWFFGNGKTFILSQEEHTRVMPTPRPERPRQQRSSRSTSASRGSRRITFVASSSAEQCHHQRDHS
ncbi:hypothetical protein V6N13_098721 [Hibiscus sabdariffa]